MSTAYQIVVCAEIVPDPLQTLEAGASPTGPASGFTEATEIAVNSGLM